MSRAALGKGELFKRLTLSAYRRFVAIVAMRLRRGKRVRSATPAQRERAHAEFGRELWSILHPPWDDPGRASPA